jgi:adenine specific DNA methylase Mod
LGFGGYEERVATVSDVNKKFARFGIGVQVNVKENTRRKKKKKKKKKEKKKKKKNCAILTMKALGCFKTSATVYESPQHRI